MRAGTEVFTADLVADFDGDGATDVLQVFGSQNILSKARAAPARGSFEQRGTSGPGSGGIAMSFGASGPCRIDQFLELRVRGALGGAFGVVVLGPTAGELRDVFGPGQNFYLDPTAPLITVPVVLAGVPGVPGQGTLALPVFIPPSLLGVELHHQLAVVDPATPSGLATSNGLRLRYGN